MTSKSAYSPRNPWGQLLDALDLDPKFRFERAELINAVQYHKEMDRDFVSALLAALEVGQEEFVEPKKFNRVSDLSASKDPALRLPFRKAKAQRPPSPYPFDLMLPERAGLRNSITPFHQLVASNRGGTVRPQKLLLIYAADDANEAEAFVHALARQVGDAIVNAVISLADAPTKLTDLADRTLENAKVVNFPLLSDQMNALVAAQLPKQDGVGFLSGKISFDPGCVERASQLLSVSDKVVQGFWPLSKCPPKTTVYATSSAQAFKSRYPFRELQGCNLLMPAKLLSRTGLLDPRFSRLDLAAKELGWRCFNLGAWFSPLLVEEIEEQFSSAGALDAPLFRSLCPNTLDRTEDGLFEVPKVSVYIPAYNAAEYIIQAVESVLNQDVDDLEVCIAVDGSPDSTLEVLDKRFGEDARVRFADGINGGIGHASNRAIEMSRGMYVGQLDSDDLLVPGAIRRLMTYLDENPDVACAYGSCERVNAEGERIGEEYSWPEFSRQKMMVTSIAHHFRMFRRAAWERTEKFRTDIINAVDYDIFLKLMETGRFRHIDEIMYQRRWHGENTSIVNEASQTQNTYHVQREALRRMNLSDFWNIKIRDPEEPRMVTYSRDESKPRLFFWPDYSKANPYQHLLYGQLKDQCEVMAGPISLASHIARNAPQSGPMIFHLHWTNFLFIFANDEVQAKTNVEAFLGDLRAFKEAGGSVIWTVHNLVSHESPYLDLEKRLINEVLELADTIHLHSAASIAEVRTHFDLPPGKIRIAPHGSYLGVYSDYVGRGSARGALSLEEDDEVILFAGQVRPYKGVEELIEAFVALASSRPKLKLVIAGEVKFDSFDDLFVELSDDLLERIIVFDRFLDESELQVFYRAADVVVLPYRSILTSGSMLLALSFGVPAVVPCVGMTHQVLRTQGAGIAYNPTDPSALVNALSTVLASTEFTPSRVLAVAKEQHWTGLKEIVTELL